MKLVPPQLYILRILFLFGFVFTISEKTTAQYIVAGHYGAYDNYKAINSNIVAYVYGDGIKDTSVSIDLNGDGIYDFAINISCDVGISHQITSTTISQLNGSSIAWGLPDPCSLSPMALNIKLGDTINRNLNWDSSSCYLDYQFFVVSGGSSCAANFSNSDTAFFGVRVISLSDTLYAWVRVTAVNGCEATIIDYACNRNPIVTKNYIKINPNPSHGLFTIVEEEPTSQLQIKIYNELGREMYYGNIAPGNTQLDLTKLAHGTYLYRIISENGKPVTNGKLIIE